MFLFNEDAFGDLVFVGSYFFNRRSNVDLFLFSTVQVIYKVDRNYFQRYFFGSRYFEVGIGEK